MFISRRRVDNDGTRPAISATQTRQGYERVLNRWSPSFSSPTMSTGFVLRRGVRHRHEVTSADNVVDLDVRTDVDLNASMAVV